ncbi:MAG: hypothetical protein PF637_14065 [Spirochaetes bacterium]|jgi:hypothetical protein|nr:hypothetical protein [Spirochaetota bacterium]
MFRKIIKWCDNTWYHYSFYIVVSLTLGLTALSITYQFITRVVPDARIGYYRQQLTIQERKMIMDYMAPVIEDINQDGIKQVGLSAISEYVQLKLSIVNQSSQMLIIDRATFAEFAPHEPFEPLDLQIKRTHPTVIKHPEIVVTSVKSRKTHIYALPLSQNSVFRNLDIPHKDLYIVMLRKDLKKDTKSQKYFANATKIMQHLIKDLN